VPQESVFRTYTIQSAAENNAINLELPLDPLHRALKSAHGAPSASLRLTKKDNVPLLALTIVRNTVSSAPPATLESASAHPATTAAAASSAAAAGTREQSVSFGGPARELEAIVTQNVPVLVLNAAEVEGIVEPRCREPDVHIILPALAQVKAISDRFTRIASGARSAAANAAGGAATALAGTGPRLELSANMHGMLRLSVRTDALSISSVWAGLTNPDLDPTQVEGGEEGIRSHPSTRMRELGDDDDDDDTSEEGWATVRIDGRDWSKVLSVGQLGGRVIACMSSLLPLLDYSMN
jgi:HUS1 checkpoint protein